VLGERRGQAVPASRLTRNSPSRYLKDMYDLAVLFELPEWQKPLWAALERRGVGYTAFDRRSCHPERSEGSIVLLVLNEGPNCRSLAALGMTTPKPKHQTGKSLARAEFIYSTWIGYVPYFLVVSIMAL